MSRSEPGTPARAVLSAAAVCAAFAGCADRRITIDSTPPGAVVYLNDEEVGLTPCETNFTYFGVYDVRLHKEGYEPLVTRVKADAPPHEWPGLDLAAMAVPGVKRTSLRWHFDLAPATTDPAALLARAAAMRDSESPASSNQAAKP